MQGRPWCKSWVQTWRSRASIANCLMKKILSRLSGAGRRVRFFFKLKQRQTAVEGNPDCLASSMDICQQMCFETPANGSHPQNSYVQGHSLLSSDSILPTQIVQLRKQPAVSLCISTPFVVCSRASIHIKQS